jgi:hypothetical protein
MTQIHLCFYVTTKNENCNTYILHYNVIFVTFIVTDIIFFVQSYIFRHYDYRQLIETELKRAFSIKCWEDIPEGARNCMHQFVMWITHFRCYSVVELLYVSPKSLSLKDESPSTRTNSNAVRYVPFVSYLKDALIEVGGEFFCPPAVAFNFEFSM